jgi:diguanylate cyclase (GGDEF)-like protein
VLIAIAGLARAAARSVDTVARIGGDEFVILMPETEARDALPLAERLREACSRAVGSGAARITCSIGLVTFARPPNDVEELLTRADALMYAAKAAGGDRVRHARVDATQSTETDGRLLPFAPRSGA